MQSSRETYRNWPCTETAGYDKSAVSMPADINVLLDAAASAEPARIYLRQDGKAVTLEDLAAVRDRLCGALQAAGIAKGHHVCGLMPTGLHGIALVFALAKLRAIWVAPNFKLPPEALTALLETAAVTHIVAAEEFSHAARAAAAALSLPVFRLSSGEARSDVRLDAIEDGAVAGKAEPDEIGDLALFFTSGTTGSSKAVRVSHNMLIHAAMGALIVSDAREGDVFHCWEPLHHVGGAQLTLLPLLGSIRLEIFPRFSASRFWAEVRACGASHMHFLGGILDILLKAPPSHLDRDHNLRIAWGGGVRAETWRAFSDRFGVDIRECYGMTECSSIATVNDRGPEYGIGYPLPWFDVEVRDPQTGIVMPDGKNGEIVVIPRAEDVIAREYFRNPAATATAFREGVLFTSDLGVVDAEGALHFRGRLGDNLRCRGENVSAFEIEHIVKSHPDIEDAAVIGVPAEIGEQDLKLFVQPVAGRHIDFDALHTWLSGRLASFQMPRFIERVDDFERTPSQRIRKGLLSADTRNCWERDRPESLKQHQI